MTSDGTGQLICLEDINESLHLREYSHTKFQYICIMAGCDYNKNLAGVGLTKATHFINKISGDLDHHDLALENVRYILSYC